MTEDYKLYTIDIEKSVSSLRQKQVKLENAFPRLNIFEYRFFNSDGGERYNLTKWFRNAAVMDNFRAVRKRFSEFFIAAEYFQGKIKFERVEIDFEESDKHIFFISIAADSLRSILDIFAVSLAWFYDFENKDNIGFAYKSFLQHIKPLSHPIFEAGNEIFKSKAFKIVKDFRDAQKHTGLEKDEFTLSKNGTNMRMKVAEAINCLEIDNAIAELYEMILSFSETYVVELLKTNKGYNSPKDQTYKLNERGNLAIE